MSSVAMGNVLDPSKQQQVLALGRLGWPLRRIERETGVRRETVSAYLRAAGVAVRGRGRPGEARAKPAISGEVSTDPPRAVAAARPRAVRERVRAVPRSDRRGARPRPQCDGDLAGPGRRPRLCRRATRASGASCGSCAAGRPSTRASSSPRAPGEEAPGRLRRGADGPAPARRASIAGRGSSS